VDKNESQNEVMVETVSYSYYSFFKRLMDIVGGLIGILLVGVSYVILFIPYHFGENSGKIIFKQKRIGKNGEYFYIYKFRSMKEKADEILKSDKNLYEKYIENGYKLEPEEDPRITRLGYFIRKLSIDEIPQFINVLKGEMSLVGPRPIVLEELSEYTKNGKKEIFLSMKPGITGVWQTSGRSNIGYPDRIFLEISYANNKSILFDLKIIFLTVIKVFKKEGAY
jgi:exopolysaccharide production protein ExoY